MSSQHSLVALSTPHPVYATVAVDLSTREFRLVELQDIEHSTSPSCVLRKFSVDGTQPPYIALSYAWGRDEAFADIILNGHCFPVGRNLWHFLNQMKLSNEFNTYWIDAICINQKSDQERSHQVQLMREIYSYADSVFLWLGEKDLSSYSNQAMTFLATRKPIQSKDMNLKHFWSHRQATGVLGVCQRPYWTRIWIVQELLLARDVMIYCGPESMPWHHFQRYFDDLSIIVQHGRERHIRAAFVLESPAMNIVNVKRGWQNLQSRSMLSLLKICCNQEATDIRDKIYALHGLANDVDGLAVDYTLTVKQLLIAAFEYTCVSFETLSSIRLSRKELFRTGCWLRGILQARCHDIELHACIDAREEVLVERPVVMAIHKSTVSLLRVQAISKYRDTLSRLSDDFACAPTWRPTLRLTWEGTDAVPHYCLFRFLGCPCSSQDPVNLSAARSRTWNEHFSDHLLLEFKTRTIICRECSRDMSACTAHNDSLYGSRETATVLRPGDMDWAPFICQARSFQSYPVRVLCQIYHHFVATDIISEGEFEELKANGTLTEPPIEYREPTRHISGMCEEELASLDLAKFEQMMAETGKTARELKVAWDGASLTYS
jgi:hypothetical protein